MKQYQAALQNHLALYAQRRLGVYEQGVYNGREYAHILPIRQRYLNFLEGVRAELQEYLSARQTIRLHQYFHHLNSSQAFALNLFYPYFTAGGADSIALTSSLGVQSDVVDWDFEAIPDPADGTNVDVAWTSKNGATVFCEVKLSETGFGSTTDDVSHRDKLEAVYVPKLKDLVSAQLLEPTYFFQNYQLLRNISLLADGAAHRLLILFPLENDALHTPLNKLLQLIDPAVRERITVAHVETCLQSLAKNESLVPRLRLYANQMQEKYAIG